MVKQGALVLAAVILCGASPIPPSLTAFDLQQMCASRSPKLKECLEIFQIVDSILHAGQPSCTPNVPSYLTAYVLAEIALKEAQESALKASPAFITVRDYVNGAYNCTAPQIKTPNQNYCNLGIQFLHDPYGNRFEKQAILEKMRNSGCLDH